ncbi:MAG: hypothetical protein Q9182_001017 [Xanthomendoza sp. 2 TL-2023]
MPKGQKFVDWTNPANDKKLLHAIITTSSVNVNYEKVAKAFGDGVPPSSISLRVNKIRKEVQGNGVTSTSTQSRPVKANSTVKKVSDEASDETDEEVNVKSDNDQGQSAAHKRIHDKTISGRVTKYRKSPRQTSVIRKDYGKLLDPYNDFGDVVDEDGDPVFTPRGTSPGDSLDSDEEYTDHNEKGGEVEI